MDNITKKFTGLVDDYISMDDGLLLIYENEARNLVLRQSDYGPDCLITILSEVIRRDLDQYMPDAKEVYCNLTMAALDQVDFEEIAKPFITDAIEDRQSALEIEQTDESIRMELQWVKQ